VLVDLDSLQSRSPGSLGGVIDTGALDAEGCRRLACDGAVTRVLVTRQPTSPTDPGVALDHHDHHDHGSGHHRCCGHHGRDHPGGHGHRHPHSQTRLTDRLQTATRRLPPILGGAPTQPLEVGRTTRVIQPAQRIALAVRDGGCVVPGCDRPLAWCEAHHLWHWVHGGPTDLDNLVLVCRAHHRAVHEGGWRLTRGPDGRLTATPPHRRLHRRQPSAA
jgi:hypothetical protein